MKLDEIIPWGRSFVEYQRMFTLTPKDLKCSILGCGDGPASFNYEMYRDGKRVVSCDPLYAYSDIEISKRIEEVVPKVVSELQRSKDNYCWSEFIGVEDLCAIRLKAMSEFIKDFAVGKEQGRYQVATLPKLPYNDNQFELALVSHLLFLYSEKLSFDFHSSSLRELLRVSKELRIYPLVDLCGAISPHLDSIIKEFSSKSEYLVELISVPYRFQKQASQMLAIRKC